MKTSTSIRCLFLSAMTLSLFIPPSAQTQPIGEFDGGSDIGQPKLGGAASYDAALDEYRVSGAGSNMWFSADEGHFVWKRIKGDFIALARAEFIGAGVEPHRKIGWLARASLEPDSPYADTAVHGQRLTSLQFRRAKGAVTQETKLDISNPDVIQLERRGDTFIFSAAHFGEPLISCEVSNLALGAELFVGLFVCSHNSNVLENAIFRDVRVTIPAKPDFVPYKDFIGSRLENLDTQTGRRQVLSASAQPFEAPNWTPDAAALIYNVSGRSEGWGALRRFDLTTKKSAPIDTGTANRANNDHVLSFDGKMLGLSHQSSAHGGQSVISTLPVEGGTPKLITALAPSYLHGWSPDAKFLVYTGGRNGQFNIFKVPSEGGDEVQLTNTKELNDGPEYSPDGRFIYFNSARTGKMQLWRMTPDGKNQEQITNDEFNNWFPHISPDGKQLAFISFMKDIPAGDHPYYKHVYLRLMPIEGGAPKVIAYLYGGQGTINVPSWAPDSRRLAFVSNTDMQ
jgi:hypothetical protein